MRRKIKVSFRGSRVAPVRSFEETSISTCKRSDSKTFICEQSGQATELSRLRSSMSRLYLVPPPGLLPMPRLRHVLDPRLALIADQNKRQSVSIRSAKLIHARASAGFWDRPYPAGFLNCDGITCDGIVAPDLCLWRCSHDVKCTVRIDCPDGAKRVRPCAGESSRAGCGSGRTRAHQHYQSACENNSKRVL